jgi:hypothetical protein
VLFADFAAQAIAELQKPARTEKFQAFTSRSSDQWRLSERPWQRDVSDRGLASSRQCGRSPDHALPSPGWI